MSRITGKSIGINIDIQPGTVHSNLLRDIGRDQVVVIPLLAQVIISFLGTLISQIQRFNHTSLNGLIIGTQVKEILVKSLDVIP
ncbi:hypothetical protein D3C85_1807330 [compost metagenome]